MEFLLLVCDDSSDRAWADAMSAHGVLRAGARVWPTADATAVRRRGDAVLVQDGPVADPHDRIGAFALVECADLDEAIAVAASHPGAERGAVEIRPVRR